MNNSVSSGCSQEKSAVLLCCHGSRDPASARGSQAVGRRLMRRIGNRPVYCAFLEFAEPTISATLQSLVDKGVRHIDAVPLMLGAAGHVKNDIAWLVREFAARHPDIQIRMTRDLGLHPLMLQLAKRRMDDALAQHPDYPIEKTALLVVGRGTSDPDANGDIAKLTRLLQEPCGFSVAMTGYSGVAHPRVDAALQNLEFLPQTRIIVVPYLLFPGRLVDRVRQQCGDFAKVTSKTVVIASHLRGTHEVVECLYKRLCALDNGEDTAMNCSLCKYRTVIPGYEESLGQAQVAHHFHNEAGPGHHHT